MIVGIDGNEANQARRVGIGEYAYQLLEAFSKLLQAQTIARVYLKTPPISDLPFASETFKYRVIGPKRFWTQIALPFDLYFHRPRPNVFFTPTHYAPRFSPVPVAISLMDVSYIHFPHLFRKKDLYQLRYWTSYSVKKAKRVFTISLASKNDIIKLYNIPSEQVVVTYPGIKPMQKTQTKPIDFDTVQKRFSIRPSYILFVGTLQPRKNISKLIEAFARLAPEKNSLDLLIVGKRGWLYEEILLAPRKFEIENNVKFLEFVSDEELAGLYTHAQFFILPSLYEGFGLPILEAMQYGCPVITSNISSLPEAAGEAALYVNPNDVEDIATKMQELLKKERLKKELIQKGYQQVKKFSWEKTAKQTLTVLEELGKE